MLLNRFPDSQLGDLTNLQVKQKCFWASHVFCNMYFTILPIFTTCPTLFIFVPLELCNLKSSLHSLDTGGPLAIPGQLWSTPCPSQQRCTSGASPASVVTARRQYQQIRLRTADWHSQRLTNRIAKLSPSNWPDFLWLSTRHMHQLSRAIPKPRTSKKVQKSVPMLWKRPPSCVLCPLCPPFSVQWISRLPRQYACTPLCCNMLQYAGICCIFMRFPLSTFFTCSKKTNTASFQNAVSLLSFFPVSSSSAPARASSAPCTSCHNVWNWTMRRNALQSETFLKNSQTLKVSQTQTYQRDSKG